jgi:hypothetical protein
MVKGATQAACGFCERNACRLAFFLSLAIGFMLAPPLLLEKNIAIAMVFILTFALSMSCVAFSVKEKLRNAKAGSTLSVVASALGFAAIEACSMGTVCGAAGLGILTLAIPGAFLGYFTDYGVQIVLASIAVQLAVLWRMGCLRKEVLLRIAKS